MAKINIKVDEFNKELARFKSAKDNFRPYTQGFIKNTTDKLKGFNSDFINGFEDVLDSITDTNAPKLLDKAEKLYDAAKLTVDSIVEVDKALGDSMKKDK